jgi:selenocysteine lyase/cysteine desulfurase
MQHYDLDFIRSQIIGRDLLFETPYGRRHLLYADYTASGRGVALIEDKLRDIEHAYANTHTEDDYSGKYLTNLLRRAEERIKSLVNAGPHGKVIAAGSGTTGALKKLQEIIGVYLPPVTRERIRTALENRGAEGAREWREIARDRPVVFIGPYEHHTNELMWREAFVEVVKIPLDREGGIDLATLESALQDPRYAGRLRMGSFSAGSNITGIRTRVYDIARMCHAHGAWVFFDFAAVAPYIRIDMNHNDSAFFDAVFFSPHKFLGGPGTSGLLIFHERIYRRDLPPTTAGGGTVRFVGFDGHDFAPDIETREKAGTPPILQTIKAAMVMELKERIGVDTIEAVEARSIRRFVEALRAVEGLELLGRVEPERRVSIVSFNLKHRDRILHPKFVTRLMNDLFGIQSRAGCSCAGPYGHILLGIDDSTSEKLRTVILDGCEGIKPGWVRVNLHYTLTDSDVDYLIRAIRFIARHGRHFLHDYAFNLRSAEWRRRDWEDPVPEFSLDENFRPDRIDPARLPEMREESFRVAEERAERLAGRGEPDFIRDEKPIESLKSFYYAHAE